MPTSVSPLQTPLNLWTFTCYILPAQNHPCTFKNDAVHAPDPVGRGHSQHGPLSVHPGATILPLDHPRVNLPEKGPADPLWQGHGIDCSRPIIFEAGSGEGDAEDFGGLSAKRQIIGGNLLQRNCRIEIVDCAGSDPILFPFVPYHMLSHPVILSQVWAF